jgi:hypothetical protein
VFCDLVGDSDKVLFKLIQGGPSNGSLFGVLEQKTQLAPANESGLAESAVADQMVRLDRQLEVRVVKGHETSVRQAVVKKVFVVRSAEFLGRVENRMAPHLVTRVKVPMLREHLKNLRQGLSGIILVSGKPTEKPHSVERANTLDFFPKTIDICLRGFVGQSMGERFMKLSSKKYTSSFSPYTDMNETGIRVGQK